MKVIFSHGKESGPWGFKINHLAAIAKQYDCSVDSIDYTDLMDADQRVARLLSALTQETEAFVLVGSSMGGYVSLAASESIDNKGLFLMAPALYMPGFEKQQHKSKSPLIDIVHGWSDDVIPVEHSIRFAKHSDCGLHLISGDHALNGVLEEVEVLFVRFLEKVLKKSSITNNNLDEKSQ